MQHVVFVAIDIEVHERAHSQITEIGIATLDTRDIAHLAPSENGLSWHSKIRARHFRIEEYAHHVNHEYVRGCPDRFEFGTSEFIPLREAKSKITECFRPPFATARNAGEVSNTEPTGAARNTVLVGHDIKADLSYLRRLGFNPETEVTNLIGTLDSATMYATWRRDHQISSLGKVLADYDIVGWNLHNAGNDAVYTIQALLGICVRESVIRGIETSAVDAAVAAVPEEEDDDDGDIVI